MADHKAGFEAALKENPYDCDTRLIFADWLEENGFDDEAVEQRRKATPEWVEAHKAIEDFSGALGMTDRELLELATKHAESGEYFYLNGNSQDESYKHIIWGQEEQFWSAYQIVTGKVVEEDRRGDIFACSC